VLAAVDNTIHRFSKRPLRNRRQQLPLPPTISFDHPLLRKRTHLEVFDISTSGFSVCENAADGILLPGMIIPDLIIVFAGSFRVTCAAQVIYRLEQQDGNVRCGLAILDMDIVNYGRLADILINSMDPCSHISSEINTDALWEFFFNTGFIYPEKYTLIHAHRQDFKKTYQRLYRGNLPEIARHFIYQKDGRILGHLSMIRAYERAWLMQHLAARKSDRTAAGFKVLQQIIYFADDGKRFPGVKMDYLLAYYRPENKFPERVFGGFTKSLDNPKGCSIDSFAYLHYATDSEDTELPKHWSLSVSTETDLVDLKRFYDHASGGLLLDAARTGSGGTEEESVEDTYQRFGFLRKRLTYSLYKGGDLTAVFLVNQSALGINLSDLLNSISILVVDPDGQPWNILRIAIARLTVQFDPMGHVPVLIYPVAYADQKNIPYERQYQHWILNLRYSGNFAEFMQKRFRVGYG
jgi:hypothetical protein